MGLRAVADFRSAAFACCCGSRVSRRSLLRSRSTLTTAFPGRLSRCCSLRRTCRCSPHFAGPRLGAAIYNLVHTYALALVLVLAGFSGALPWLMLDEPTIGQDRSTSAALAAIIAHLCDNGHGVIVVTHDDSFAAKIVHRELRIEEMMIRSS